jgi:hypothetical protein
MADFFAQYNQGNGGGSTGTLPPIKDNFLNGPPRAAVSNPAPQQGGLGGFIHRAAQSFVTPFEKTGKALAYTPEAIMREIHNKPIGDIQQKAFGTKNQGNIARSIVGNLAQVGASVATPELKGLGVGSKILQGAKIGAVGGAGSALSHKGSSAADVLTGGVEGGLTGGGVGGAGGFLSKLLRGKTGSIADNATSSSMAAAKRSAGFRQPVLSGASQLQRHGTNLLGHDLNISPKDSANFKAPETVARLQREHGMTVRQAADAHPAITGSEGATTHAMDNALHGMGNVNFGDFKATIQSHFNDPEYQAANLSDGVSSAQGKALQSVIDKYHEALNPASETAVTKGGVPQPTGLNASTAMQIARKLEKDGISNRASTSANKNALGDLQGRMADHIKTTIYSAPGGHVAFEGAKADAVKSLSDLAQQSGNKKLASVASAIGNTRNFSEFRNVSEPFVNAKSLIEKSNHNDLAGSGKASNGGAFSTAKNAVSKVISPTIGKIASNAGNKAAGETASKPGIVSNNALSKFITTNKVVSAGAKLAKRGAIVGSAAAAANPPQSKQNNQSTSASNISDLVNTLPDGSASSSTASQDQNTPFTSSNIQAAILQDMEATGGKHVSELLSLYNAFGKPSTAANKLSTTEQNTVDSLNSALATLGTYNDQLNASGGGRGSLGGNAENVLGKFGLGGTSGKNVRAIESQKTDVATSIAKALTGGKPSSAQIKSWEDAIPNVTDTPAVAKQKMQNITDSINSKLATYQK